MMTKFLLMSALALLAVDCRGEESRRTEHDLPAPFTAAEFKKHVVFLASDELAGRAPGSEGSEQAAKYLTDQFKTYGLQPLQESGEWYQKFPLNAPEPTTDSLFANNVVAVLSGRGALQAEAVIVCAHYDHLGTRPRPGREGVDTIYNGADDNASGVSALLLVAQAVASQQDLLPSSCRTVIFIAFDAEEQGLLGSRHYVVRPLWPLEKTAAVINFDAMGLMRDDKFFASDVETNPMLAETVRQAAHQCGVVAETQLGGHGRSDHAVFQIHEIACMHFFTGASVNYHQVTDHWEHLNLEGAVKIAWVGREVLRKAMTHPDRIEYHELSASSNVQQALKFVQTLGIIPKVNAQQGRYPEILFVTPQSPAAENGLKAGDKVTALNGLRFNRVEDALVIFQQLEFTEGLRIEVLRGGETVEITIPAQVFEGLVRPEEPTP